MIRHEFNACGWAVAQTSTGVKSCCYLKLIWSVGFVFVGEDDAWIQALKESEGSDSSSELETGTPFWSSSSDAAGASRQANQRLLKWMKANKVHVSEQSGWGLAPDPLVISSETFDDNNGALKHIL